ncbi:MAG: DUF5615 family PIN-like protein [Pseudomonadota bacterium]|nr:DUF5615 family PIN-like protein [Pseudomonadota bacterium]
MRHASLPTVSDAFAALGNDGRLRIVADFNLEPQIIKQLQARDFIVACVAETKSHGAPDEEIYGMALRHRAMLFTHDRDFADFERFNLKVSPGVVILPQRPDRALAHFFSQMPHRAEHWVSKVIEYEPEGTVVIYSLPLKPTRRHVDVPTVRWSGYLPRP